MTEESPPPRRPREAIHARIVPRQEVMPHPAASRAPANAAPTNPAPVVSRRVDGKLFDTAAREVMAAANAKTRILPANKMTRADESLCHFLTEGDLARIENASKFGGSSNLASLVYGALFGIAVPYIASISKMFKEGLGTLAAADVVSLFIGTLLIGGSAIVLVSSRRHETVQAVCGEFRSRPQQEVE